MPAVPAVLRVTDDEIADAMRIYYADTHNVAEGAGAAPLAGCLQEKELVAGKRVGLILSGGNIDTNLFSQVLNSDVIAN